MERLIERPQPKQNNHETRDCKSLLIGRLRIEIAEVDVVDEVGRRREQPVVRRRNNLCEDSSHQQRAQQAKWARTRKTVQPKISKNLPRTRLNLSTGKQTRPRDRERHDNGLENNRADDPSNHRPRSILLRLS